MATSICAGERPDRPEEACAVFGAFAPGEDVARMTFFGLQALQHRGQESAGIAVGDGETILIHKGLGLVDQVFSEEALAHLTGSVAVGHTRYSTAGGSSWKEAQPHISAITDEIIALAHNGTPVEADMVLGVPDSGIPSALGYAHASGIPYRDCIVKNRYVGRTFIQPTQEMRQMGIRMKLNPLPSMIAESLRKKSFLPESCQRL